MRANDISQSGFSFITEQELAVGDLVVLGLRADDDFLVQATVRNVRRHGEQWVIGAERV